MSRVGTCLFNCRETGRMLFLQVPIDIHFDMKDTTSSLIRFSIFLALVQLELHLLIRVHFKRQSQWVISIAHIQICINLELVDIWTMPSSSEDIRLHYENQQTFPGPGQSLPNIN